MYTKEEILKLDTIKNEVIGLNSHETNPVSYLLIRYDGDTEKSLYEFFKFWIPEEDDEKRETMLQDFLQKNYEDMPLYVMDDDYWKAICSRWRLAIRS